VVEDSALDNRTVMIGGTTGILANGDRKTPTTVMKDRSRPAKRSPNRKNGSAVRIGTSAGLETVTSACAPGGSRKQVATLPGDVSSGAARFRSPSWRLPTPFSLTKAGAPPPPHILDRIEDKNGHIVWQAEQGAARRPVIKPGVAYEITSCLTDRLARGDRDDSLRALRSEEISCGRQDRHTAYDFTRRAFAGYDSQITCAVWAGFDKPQRIYRGAFGSVLALPVWVDVMNASTGSFAPREFPIPPDVHKMEICSKSGLLATDKWLRGLCAA
jgi:penicillin-binding protein 1A